MVPLPDQMLYIRPEYPSPESFESAPNEASENGSVVEYAMEDVESVMPDGSQIPKVMVDTAVEANKN